MGGRGRRLGWTNTRARPLRVSGGWLPQKAGGDGVDLDSSHLAHLFFLSPPSKPLEPFRSAAVQVMDALSNEQKTFFCRLKMRWVTHDPERRISRGSHHVFDHGHHGPTAPRFHLPSRRRPRRPTTPSLITGPAAPPHPPPLTRR
jgi:hypothetical protein